MVHDFSLPYLLYWAAEMVIITKQWSSLICTLSLIVPVTLWGMFRAGNRWVPFYR